MVIIVKIITIIIVIIVITIIIIINLILMVMILKHIRLNGTKNAGEVSYEKVKTKKSYIFLRSREHIQF